jgi:LPPG:FO 2-phospho-L-lactate transferase
VNVTVLVGGVGGARFLQGVRKLLGTDGAQDGDSPTPRITAVVNVGDDVWMHGLRICPDLDTCMYTLGGGIDTERGWGHAGETWNAKEELAAYGAKPDWFGLGDRDIATHLIRSQMLRTGYPLSAVTEALCNRWQPGVALLPVTDDRSETHVVITDPEDGEQRAIHFQEWWVRHRAQVPTHSFAHIGAEQAKPAPGVVEAIESADIVLLAPSNPVVSIGASRTESRCAAWRTNAWTSSGSRRRRRRSDATTGRAAGPESSTAGWFTTPTPPTFPGSRSGVCR